jgi:AcrR family transcriptional regulator
VSNNPRAPGRRSQAESARTRARILDRAERLFARRGYRGVSVREIASASGVRPFTIQHHFGSKVGLYRAVLDRWDEEVRALLSRAVAGQTDIGDAVENVVETLFEFFLAKRSWMAVTARAALGEGLPRGVTLGDRSWVQLIDATTRERRFGSLKLDLGLLLITVEGILNNHVLARAHYRQLYGRDVTDPKLKARTKEHLRAVILALVRADR